MGQGQNYINGKRKKRLVYFPVGENGVFRFRFSSVRIAERLLLIRMLCLLLLTYSVKKAQTLGTITQPQRFFLLGTKCKKCGCTEFDKEKDIMDVWFDSGSSHAAVLEQRDNLESPADLYLEGNDQYRGWFQSSLLTSVATRGRAPYKAVLTHGMILDDESRKMSKSLGNGISPQDVIKQYGADVLRLWVASTDYRTDVHISKDILKQISESYRKIRNTARYILGNIF